MRQVWLMARRVILLGALLLVPAAAHEVRPGYIEINETERDRSIMKVLETALR